MGVEGTEAARAVAFRFLAYAPRSRAEMERRLERAGFEADVVQVILAELVERGYLDDAQLARTWVEDRADRKRYGRARLAAELRRKGVEKEAVEEAIGSLSAEGEGERALAAAKTHWRPDVMKSLGAAAAEAEKRK